MIVDVDKRSDTSAGLKNDFSCALVGVMDEANLITCIRVSAKEPPAARDAPPANFIEGLIL
jgi:hypothetical protein